MLAHGEDEGQHGGHGKRERAFAVSRDQAGEEAGKRRRGDDGEGIEARKGCEGGEQDRQRQREAEHPGFLAQGIRLIGDRNRHCAGGRCHRCCEAAAPAHQQARQAHAQRDGQAIFDMHTKNRQRQTARGTRDQGIGHIRHFHGRTAVYAAAATP